MTRYSIRIIVLPDAIPPTADLVLQLERGPIQIVQLCPDWPAFLADLQTLTPPPHIDGKITIHVTDLATHIATLELLDYDGPAH